MTLRKVILTPELVEEARLVYDAGAVSVDEMAAILGIKRAAFFNFRKKHGWKLRRVFNHPERTEEPNLAPILPGRSRTPDELVPKIEAAINREFAHIEHALAHGHPRDAEKTARTMASLVRSLATQTRAARRTGPWNTQRRSRRAACARSRRP